MTKVSPTQRSLKEMRKRGYTCGIVEKWNPHVMIRQDLFGIIDIICIRDGETVGLQTTSSSNLMARFHKAIDNPNLAKWLRAGNRYVLHGWALQGPRGEAKKWVLDEREIVGK